MTVRVPILSTLYMLATFTCRTNWATILMLPTTTPTILHIDCASPNILQTTMTAATMALHCNCVSARPRALTTMTTVAAPRKRARPRKTLALPRLLRAKGGSRRLNYCNSCYSLLRLCDPLSCSASTPCALDHSLVLFALLGSAARSGFSFPWLVFHMHLENHPLVLSSN